VALLSRDVIPERPKKYELMNLVPTCYLPGVTRGCPVGAESSWGASPVTPPRENSRTNRPPRSGRGAGMCVVWTDRRYPIAYMYLRNHRASRSAPKPSYAAYRSGPQMGERNRASARQLAQIGFLSRRNRLRNEG